MKKLIKYFLLCFVTIVFVVNTAFGAQALPNQSQLTLNQSTPVLLIEIDQPNNEVRVSDSVKTVALNAVTPKKGYLLRSGRYEIKDVPPCIRDGATCKSFDGLYKVQPKHLKSSLREFWGSDKVVWSPIFFVPKGEELKADQPNPAFHAPPVSVNETPPLIINKGIGSHGCFRLGWRDLQWFFTVVNLAYEQGVEVVINVL